MKLKQRARRRAEQARIRKNLITSFQWLAETFPLRPTDEKGRRTCFFCNARFLSQPTELIERLYLGHLSRDRACYVPVAVIDLLLKYGFVQLPLVFNARATSTEIAKRGVYAIALGSSIEHAHIFLVPRWIAEMLLDWERYLSCEMAFGAYLDAITSELRPEQKTLRHCLQLDHPISKEQPRFADSANGPNKPTVHEVLSEFRLRDSE